MILVFVLIAGVLAAGAAMLLLWPLLRRREQSRPSAITAVAVLSGMLLGGAGLYAAFSNYKWVEATAVADTPAAMAAKLARRLIAEPNDLDGWLMLGRSYGVLQQYPLAIRAYQRADRIAGGKNVEAILGVAESMLAEDTEQLNGAAGRLFERALQLEPANPKAVFYGAFAALARGELPVARARFEQMLALNPPPQIREIIEKRIGDIDASLNGAASPAAPAVADNAKISVHVTLAPALAAKVASGAPLFVAARDPKQPGPPFAVKRMAASFPVDVELTGADAMLASRHITSGQQLEVVARIALGGTPTASSGDPFGQVSYHVGKDEKLNIVIDRLAP